MYQQVSTTKAILMLPSVFPYFLPKTNNEYGYAAGRSTFIPMHLPFCMSLDTK